MRSTFIAFVIAWMLGACGAREREAGNGTGGAGAAAYYTAKCAVCHGEQGKGDGTAAATLDPLPTDFTLGSWQATRSDSQIYDATVGGGVAVGKSAGMPPSPDLKNSPTLANDIVLFIRAFSVTHALGEVVSTGPCSITVTQAQECPSTGVIKPDVGNRFVGAEVQVTALAEGGVPVNPFSATLTDSDRNSFSPWIGTCEPVFTSGHPAKGESSSGWITFEVPFTALGMRLHYRPFVSGADPKEVSFLLGNF